MSVRRKLKDLQRFQQIVSVLSKQGFGIIFDNVKPHHSTLRQKPEVRLRKAMEELGGAFAKLGQMLALRPDLLPPKYCTEFEKLQDQGKQITFAEFKAVLEQEYSRPLDTIFKKIETKALAVGSVAQVHKATLVNGKQVIIKIIKPKIKEKFDEDIDILLFLAAKINKHLKSDIINPHMIFKEFQTYTVRELDFTYEKRNIKKFHELDLQVRTPSVYEQLCTKNVLIMEYINGTPLTKHPYKDYSKLVRSRLARQLTESTMQQVFVHGFFHADPHPGNILILNTKKLALIDFGIVGTIDTKTKITLTIILYALIHKDTKLLARGLLRLGFAKNNVDQDELEEDLKNTLGKYYDSKLSQINISNLFVTSINVAKKHKLAVPQKMVLIGKAMVTIESVCHLLEPNFVFIDVAKPFLKKYIPTMVSSRIMLNEAKDEILDYGELLLNMPKDVKNLISLKEEENKTMSQLQTSLSHVEKQFTLMQKEFVLSIVGIALIIISLVTNTGQAVAFGLSATSVVLFCIGCLMMISILHLLNQ